MSVHIVCMIEFFKKRICPQLGLNALPDIMPGSSFFLCGDIAEVSRLVTSQKSGTLKHMSEGGKVQIFICKDRSNANVAAETASTTASHVILDTGSTPAKSDSDSETPEGDTPYTKIQNNTLGSCTVTSSSDVVVKVEGGTPIELKHHSTPNVLHDSRRAAEFSKIHNFFQGEKTVAVDRKVNKKHTVEQSVSFKDILRLDKISTFNTLSHSSAVIKQEPIEKDSDNTRTSLPCTKLRRELKQAILQRRKDLGKTSIDWMKEELEKQKTLSRIQMTKTELENQMKRRAANNRAAQKSREKRKLREQTMQMEVKRLRDHKLHLKQMVETLEIQQNFLRGLCSSGKNTNDVSVNSVLRDILSSDIVVPILPRPGAADEPTGSVDISSSEYNSDDTSNGYELESSQSTDFGSEYTEITEDSRVLTSKTLENSGMMEELRNFKDLESEALKQSSGEDSDLELIDINNPLVIDVE